MIFGRRQRVEELCRAAREQPPTERAVFLTRACQGDDELRREVETLLSEPPVADSSSSSVGSRLPHAGDEQIEIGSLFGPYRIEARLGVGGMGTVFRAFDTRLQRSVAIKVAQEAYSERFRKEALAISTLNHPNICTLYDAGANFLVMELLEGPTLAEEIAKGAIDPARAASIGAQIAAAIAEAHRLGVVHRDLKPGNVMLTQHGVKVLDFGIAKVRSSMDLTRTSALLGTPAYMAPEQTLGREIDARADLFALGLILYEMIGGRLPYPGASLGNMLTSGSAVSIDPPARGAGKVIARLNALVLRLLARDPDERGASADAVRDELAAFAAGTPRRRITWPIAAGALAATVALALVIAWWSNRDGGSRERWPAPSQVSLITHYPGDEANPAASRDGSLVAFSWDGEQGAHRDIYVMPVDGVEQPRRLTRDASGDTADTYPAWSPDGSRIAFVRKAGAVAGELIIIPAEGGAERKLRDIRFLTFPASSWLAWSPDGESIYFASESPESGKSTLYSVGINDDEVRPLSTPPDGVIGDSSPALSPDGRTLAFLRWSSPSTSTLFVQPLGRDAEPVGQATAVYSPAVNGGPRSLAWADDTRLVFAERQRILEWERNAPDVVQIFVSRSEVTGLTVAGADPTGVARLLTAQRNVASHHVSEIPLRRPGLAAGPPAMISEFGNEVGAPEYSADGRHVALIASRGGNPEVWVADPDGSHSRQMTHMSLASLGVARWSPDSRHLAFFARMGTEPQIYVIDTSKENPSPEQLTNEEPGCNIPNWSRDGKYIYCSRNLGGEMRLYRVPVEGSTGQVSEMERWFEGKEAKETSDGRILYIKNNRPGLFARSLKGDPTQNAEERLIDDIQGPIAYFAPVDQGIYYTGQEPLGTYRALRFFDYSSKTSTDVAAREITGNVGSLTTSLDGTELIYTEGVPSETDLTLIQF